MLPRRTSRPSCRPISVPRCRLSSGASGLPRIRARLRMPNRRVPCSRLQRGPSTWLNLLLPALTRPNQQALPRRHLHSIHLREWGYPRPCNLPMSTTILHPISLPWRNSPQPLNLPLQSCLVTALSFHSTLGNRGFISWDLITTFRPGLPVYNLKN